jgi:hypothetical protein
MPKFYVGVRRKNHLTFSRRCLRHLLHSGMTYFKPSWSKRVFKPFLHSAGNPTNRSATGKDIKGHFEITPVHCCKRAVFWRLRLGFPRIRHILEAGTPLRGGCLRRRDDPSASPLTTNLCIPIIDGKISVGVRRREASILPPKQGFFRVPAYCRPFWERSSAQLMLFDSLFLRR